jgi:hypothetical protein
MTTDTTCQHVHCSERATVSVAVPAVAPGLGDMVMPYCEEHACGILADALVFPGARRVTVLGAVT